MARVGRTRLIAASYIILAGLQRGVSFLILPLVARVMSPAEYGGVTMVSAASFFIVCALAAPLETTVMYSAPKAGETDRAHVRVAGFYSYYAFPLITSLLAAAAFGVSSFLGVPGKIWAIELLAVGFQPAMSFALAFVRATQDVRRFLVMAGSSLVFYAVAKLTFVVIWKLGMLGWVVSDLTAAILSYVMALLIVRLPQMKVTRKHVNYVFAFTAAIVPHTVSIWAVSSLSRPLLARVSTLSQVGLLSAALSVSSAVTIFILEINRAVQPRFSLETFPAPTDKTYIPVATQISLALAIPGLGGAVFALIGQWIFPAPYWPAFPVTAVLLIGQIAYGLYPIAMNYLVLTGGISKLSSIASSSGAIIIMISILAVGGAYGALGVAYATSFGLFAMAAVAFLLTRAAKLDIRWRKWRVFWPQMIPMLVAFVLCEAALTSPVGSPTARLLAGASLAVLLIGGIPLVLRSRSA